MLISAVGECLFQFESKSISKRYRCYTSCSVVTFAGNIRTGMIWALRSSSDTYAAAALSFSILFQLSAPWHCSQLEIPASALTCTQLQLSASVSKYILITHIHRSSSDNACTGNIRTDKNLWGHGCWEKATEQLTRCVGTRINFATSVAVDECLCDRQASYRSQWHVTIAASSWICTFGATASKGTFSWL